MKLARHICARDSTSSMSFSLQLEEHDELLELQPLQVLGPAHQEAGQNVGQEVLEGAPAVQAAEQAVVHCGADGGTVRCSTDGLVGAHGRCLAPHYHVRCERAPRDCKAAEGCSIACFSPWHSPPSPASLPPAPPRSINGLKRTQTHPAAPAPSSPNHSLLCPVGVPLPPLPPMTTHPSAR